MNIEHITTIYKSIEKILHEVDSIIISESYKMNDWLNIKKSLESELYQLNKMQDNESRLKAQNRKDSIRVITAILDLINVRESALTNRIKGEIN